MSDVSSILSGRINLKRPTSFLLDGLTPSSTLSLDRQPARSSILEITVVGATVSNGLVYVNGAAIGEVQEYVLADRYSGQKYAITVNNRVIIRTPTSNAASPEPIIQDEVTSDAWRMFLTNTFLAFEQVVSAQDDSIVLADQGVPGDNYRIVMVAGNRGLNPTNRESEVFVFDANTTVVGVTLWTSIASLTISGITGGVISVRAVNKYGQPITQEKVVTNNLPVRFYAQSGRIRMMKQGQEKIAKYKIMAEPDADVQEGDIMYALQGCFGLTYGQVMFAEKIYDFDGLTHHTEAEIMDL